MSDDPAKVRAYLQQARALAGTLDDKQSMADVLKETALYERARGNDEQALELLEQAVQLFCEVHSIGQIEALYWMAHIRLQRGELEESRRHWEEGLAEARKIETSWYIGWGLGGLSMQARYEGDLNQATALSRESLAVKWQFQDKAGLAYSLEELAMIATDERKLQRAARLWGAAEQYREMIHAVVPPIVCAEYDSHIARARAALDAVAFERAWAEGRALSIEQALAYAAQDD
jgi:non-specific serine/threonine protein kinase